MWIEEQEHGQTHYVKEVDINGMVELRVVSPDGRRVRTIEFTLEEDVRSTKKPYDLQYFFDDRGMPSSFNHCGAAVFGTNWPPSNLLKRDTEGNLRREYVLLGSEYPSIKVSLDRCVEIMERF